jgi:L-alanine-DL-glutamate epimerase-like enolase superfamily enzyme
VQPGTKIPDENGEALHKAKALHYIRCSCPLASELKRRPTLSPIMKEHQILSLETRDVRFPLHEGAGSDAVHSGSEYAFAATLLASGGGLYGTGIVLTLGQGNQLVCEAIELLGNSLVGQGIEELMADFGAVAQRLAQHPQLRWLGPQKGVIHLALASLTNACFDLWAKARGVPLWRLLLDLSSRELVKLLDLSYLEEALTPGGSSRYSATATVKPWRARGGSESGLSRIRHISRVVSIRRQPGEGVGARSHEPRISRFQT